MTILRYAALVALLTGASWATISAGAETGQKFLVDATQSGAAPQNLFLWMLGGLALLTSLSLGRFVFFSVPAMVGAWCQSHRQQLYTMVLGGMALGAYYLM